MKSVRILNWFNMTGETGDMSIVHVHVRKGGGGGGGGGGSDGRYYRQLQRLRDLIEAA